MIYDFDKIIDRRNTESVKWHKYGPDVLPMWVADMDFVSPEPVIRTLEERVAHGIFGYPTTTSEMTETIIERLDRIHHWHVEPEDLIFVPGVVTGFNLASHALSEPNGSVLVQTPVYFPFLSAPENAGMTRDEMELTRLEDGTYAIDMQAFDSAIKDNTRLFILCNPHNPVGRVFHQDELECMAEICLRHNVVICSDEIHCDLVYNGNPHISIASLDPEIAQNTITLIAPTKTYNLAGLECSVAIIQNPDLREKFQNAKQGLVGWVNLIGMLAGTVAYREGQEWLDQLMAYLEANRDYLYDYVEHELPGITMAKPEGTYLGWLDCRQSGIEGSPFEFFLERAKVATSEGAAFGQGGEGFVRLNFGCPRDMLSEALERMKAALQTL
jgi:cysteine-S-conjugate beta-lyase